MKHLIVAPLILAALFAADAPPPSVGPDHGSFEILDGKSGMPTGWHSNTAAVLVPDDTIASEGKQSIKFINFGALQDVFCYASIKPEDMTATHRISVDVRMDDYDGRAGLICYRYPPPLKPNFKVELSSDDAVEGWQTVHVDVPPKEDMASISVAIWARGTWGRVWFDNVRAVKVEAE